MSSTLSVHPREFGDYILSSISTYDVRFPTSDFLHGSDAVHKNPDYSCPYILLKFTSKVNNKCIVGHGLSFTLGRGNEIILACIESMFELIHGLSLKQITDNPLKFSRLLTCDSQMRWIGPEKGVVQLAACAINNAIFDLWSWCSNKPLWKFLSEMDISQLIFKCADFQYLMDMFNYDLETNVIQPLKQNQLQMKEKMQTLFKIGYPLYVTGAGWLGYSDERIRGLCQSYMDEGFNAFKMKVGKDINDDIRRAEIIRKVIGYPNANAGQKQTGNILMMDSNQVWEVSQAIAWMKKLARFEPYWIEEPTSADDILGHKTIANALNPLGIRVATGEVMQNRVIWKQFLQTQALQIAQLDSTRVNSVLEILPIMIMCKKFNIPVCFHAGGVGLNEMVRHYIMFDYALISQNMDGRFCEYAQHLSEHFQEECVHKKGRYYPPVQPGFVRLKMSSVKEFLYPCGPVWMNKLRKDRKNISKL